MYRRTIAHVCSLETAAIARKPPTGAGPHGV